MNAKHQFKYTYSDTNLEEFSPVEVTFDMPGDVTLTQMLYNFQSYLKACGFYFDGHLEIVDDTLKDLDLIDELDGTLYEFEDEPEGGCMADFDNECGCGCPTGPKGEEGLKGVKEWNEGIAKLDHEQKMKCYQEAIKESEDKYPIEPLYKKTGTIDYEVNKNKLVHGICNPPSPDWKKKK